MTKLIIQIPCLNEEATLPITLAALPRRVEGVDVVEWMVIDDGSTDRTAEVARAHGVDHIVRHTVRHGLALAFASGIDASLRLGADIIVNTDADNQYDASAIAALVRPILDGRADMVIGDRGTATIAHFSWSKRRLQALGSWVVRQASGMEVPDATSGFRALSRHAALKLNVVSTFSYTLETLIQAGNKNIAVESVPVATGPVLRQSRLFRSVSSYIGQSAATIVRIYSMYRPMRGFLLVGGILTLSGVAIGARFLYFWLQGQGGGKIQSLLLAVILSVVGVQTVLAGFLADLMAINRQLTEDILFRVKRLESDAPPVEQHRADPPDV
jgi:glycosyltransferase involved in cell wall biosynthesis